MQVKFIHPTHMQFQYTVQTPSETHFCESEKRNDLLYEVNKWVWTRGANTGTHRYISPNVVVYCVRFSNLHTWQNRY